MKPGDEKFKHLSIQGRIALPQSADIPIGAICGDRESSEAVQEAGEGFPGIRIQIATVRRHTLNWVGP
jgi:hypothetical protein